MNVAEIENAIKEHLSSVEKFSRVHSGVILTAALKGVPAIESEKLKLLAAIAETNKVIILQNELILQALKRKES